MMATFLGSLLVSLINVLSAPAFLVGLLLTLTGLYDLTALWMDNDLGVGLLPPTPLVDYVAPLHALGAGVSLAFLTGCLERL